MTAYLAKYWNADLPPPERVKSAAPAPEARR
jgi:hypothetical protein